CLCRMLYRPSWDASIASLLLADCPVHNDTMELEGQEGLGHPHHTRMGTVHHQSACTGHCNDDLALENEVLKQEVERLSLDLSKLKGKSVVQPSQDNRETMVKKLEKGSTVQNSCKLIHKSKESKSQARKKNMDHIKCYKCSNMG